jgi:hypothetical protein
MSEPTTITIELDARGTEILERLRGDMTPSDFFQLLLKIVDSGAVGPPNQPPSGKKPRRKKR